MRNRVALGSIAGVELRLHRSWAIIALLIAASFWSRFAAAGAGGLAALTMAAVAALLFFVSLLLHELAHALEARHRGVEVQGITLFLFGGVTEMPGEVPRPRDELAVTAIGPFTSLVLAATFGLVATYAQRFGLSTVAEVAGPLAWVNLALGIFNLLPGAPLDGGRILHAVVWAATDDRRRAQRVAAGAGQLIGLAIAGLGLAQLLLVPDALLGGIWLVVIGGFLAVSARAEVAQHAIDDALGELTVGELLEHAELPSTAADTDLAEAAEQLRMAPERALALTEADRTIGVLLLDDLAEEARTERAGRRAAEVMVALEDLPRVDHRARITEALRELADGRPLAVTRGGDGPGHIVGVVAPEQLERVVRRTLELGEPGQAASRGAQHLPDRGR